MARALLVAAVSLVAACASSSGPAVSADLDAFLADRAGGGFSGAVLVMRDGRTLVDRGFGLADRERGIEATSGTVFEVGSIAKLFTAATVMDLAEEGRLRLDDRLPRFFARVPEDKRALTVLHLIAHRSGLPEYPGFGDLLPVSRERAVRNALSLPLVFPPGQGRGYSNVGYTLLAAIVEHVTGRTFESAVRAHVFVPAGMARTGFFGERRWRRDLVAVGYGNRAPPGRNAPDAKSPSWSLKGAGGVASTTGDLARWVDAVRGRHILRRGSVERFYRLAAGPPDAVAYGGANEFGFNAIVVELPRERALVVVLTNANVLPGFVADEVAQGIEQRLRRSVRRQFVTGAGHSHNRRRADHRRLAEGPPDLRAARHGHAADRRPRA